MVLGKLSNVNFNVRNWPQKFQINILKVDYFTDQPVKCLSVKYRTVRKMQTRSYEVPKFTEWSPVIFYQVSSIADE